MLRQAVAVPLCLSLAVTAGCGGPHFSPLGVFGMTTLPACTTQASKTVFRLRVPANINDIFAATPQKHAKYKQYANPAAADGAPDEDSTNETDETSNNALNGVSIASNPFHTDLTNKNIMPGLVKYIVIVPASSNMSLMGVDPNTGRQVNGVIADASLVTKTFVCVKNLRANGRIATFFVQHGSGTSVLDGFNIVLVPTSGATDTPVVIDPKILNSG
jgi:hypothetical protein